MFEQLETLGRRLAKTPHLTALGRLFSETVLLRIDDAEYFLTFEKGVLVSTKLGPDRKIPWRFALVTDAKALEEFWAPRPKPGFHDIFGLVKIGRASIEGDILMLVKNLRFFKEFLALGRRDLPA